MVISDFLKSRQEIPIWKYTQKENKRLLSCSAFNIIFLEKPRSKDRGMPEIFLWESFLIFFLTQRLKKGKFKKDFHFPAAVKILISGSFSWCVKCLITPRVHKRKATKNTRFYCFLISLTNISDCSCKVGLMNMI